jgi:precorrin-2 methylase
MAAEDFGTAHVYGVTGTITNAKIQSVTRNEEFANTGTTENESGVVIERRYDDRTKRVTIQLKFTSTYTKPDIGDTITYDTVAYIIEKIGKEEKNKDFTLLTIEGIQSEGVTP